MKVVKGYEKESWFSVINHQGHVIQTGIQRLESAVKIMEQRRAMFVTRDTVERRVVDADLRRRAEDTAQMVEDHWAVWGSE